MGIGVLKTSRGREWLYLGALVVGVLVLIVLDQGTKGLAIQLLVPGRPLVVLALPGLGNVCLLMLVWNTGAFLSMGSGLGGLFYGVLMIGVPVVALVGMLIFVTRPVWKVAKVNSLPLSLRAALALFLAGGTGNLIDRIKAGKVIDFLNFGIGPLRTGIMNVADLYIAAGLVFLVVYYFRFYRPGQGLNQGRPI